MTRIFLFFVTNLTVLALLSIAIFAMWYSRQREYRVDRGGANLAGVGSMVGALQLLKRRQNAPQ